MALIKEDRHIVNKITLLTPIMASKPSLSIVLLVLVAQQGMSNFFFHLDERVSYLLCTVLHFICGKRHSALFISPLNIHFEKIVEVIRLRICNSSQLLSNGEIIAFNPLILSDTISVSTPLVNYINRDQNI